MYGDTSKVPCQTTGLFYFPILPLRTSFSKHRFVLNAFKYGRQDVSLLVKEEGYSHIIVNQMIGENLISVFLITAADSSHLFRMAPYRPLSF